MNDKSKPILIHLKRYNFIFFGFLQPIQKDSDFPEMIVLTESRLILSYAKSNKGLWGLAANGPNSETKLEPENKKPLYIMRNDVCFFVNLEKSVADLMQQHPSVI